MQGEPSAWVDGGHWSTTEQVVAKRGDLLPQSLKSTTTQPAVGRLKTFWEDQRVIFEVFAFCGGRTKANFKDWAYFYYQHVEQCVKVSKYHRSHHSKTGQFLRAQLLSQCRASYNVDRGYYL